MKMQDESEKRKFPVLAAAKALIFGKGATSADASVEIENSGLELPLPSDTGKSIRIGMAILVLGIGGFTLWAALAPLDEGVPASGTVIVEGQRKLVQHLSGGVVREIKVQEARRVKAGDVLIRLDDTISRANFDAAVKNWYALMAEEARLVAEQSQVSEIRFPRALLSASDMPEYAAEFMRTQQNVFSSRRASLKSDLSALEETAVAQERLVTGLGAQIAYLLPQLEGMRELANEGYMPRNRQLEVERQYADLQANMARMQSLAAAARVNLLQKNNDFRREVETHLAEVKKELATAAERVRSTKIELERTVITSPADGSVTGLMVHTEGGVVSPGQKLMDIVPEDEGLVLEIQIPSHLVDRVYAGMPADISLHTFLNLPNLIIEGRLLSVSADVIMNPQQAANTPPYYLGRVEVTQEGKQALGKNELQPGMPASVVIKTGSRSLFDYLLKPLKRRIAESLTEA